MKTTPTEGPGIAPAPAETPEPRFPQPTWDGPRRRWAESAIVNYDLARQGLPPIQRDPADERWLTSAQIRQRYQVSNMWLWRRCGRNRPASNREGVAGFGGVPA
jgi:hypothetical protein